MLHVINIVILYTHILSYLILSYVIMNRLLNCPDHVCQTMAAVNRERSLHCIVIFVIVVIVIVR